MKKVFPYLIPVLVFIALLAVYFSPEFFENKYLQQNDVQQGISVGKETTDFRNNSGEEPLWMGTAFSGMPAYMINTIYSGDWMMKLNQLLRFLAQTADAIFINFLGFYILLLCFGVNPTLAGIGGFAFAFTTYTLVSAEAGHIYKLLALGYLPIILGGIHLIFKKKWLLGFALMALGTGLQMAGQHYQITFYGLIIAAIMTVSYMISERKDVKTALIGGTIVLAGLLVGFGPSASRVWGLMEYSPYSIRGEKELVAEDGIAAVSGLDKEYAFGWSQGVWESMTIVIPRLYGGSNAENVGENSVLFEQLQKNNVPRQNIMSFVKGAPLYWGDMPFTSGPVYFGIIVLMLFILGLFTVPNKEKIWLLVGAVFMMLISFGKNMAFFNYFLFDYLPVFNKFRAVSMASSIVNVSFLLLGILGLHYWLKFDKAKQFELLKKAAIFSLGLIGFVWIASFVFLNFSAVSDASRDYPEWLISAIRDERKSVFNKDAMRSIIFTSLGLLALYLYNKDKIKINMALGLVALLTVSDLWLIDKRYINAEDFKGTSISGQVEPDAADLKILNDKGLSYRVLDLNNPFNNGLTSSFHKSIGGYHPAKIQRYQDLIENQISKNNQQVLDMLNTKYIKTTDPANPVYMRPTNSGNAWFVSKVSTVSSANEEMKFLDSLQVASEAVVDKNKFSISKTTFKLDSATATLTSYAPNKLTYQTSNGNEGFLVFSEIYYPEGWNVYVDGQKGEYLRTNYVLRAMEVPAGNHTIEWRFEPESYVVGNKISLGFSILIVLAIAGALFLEFKNYRKGLMA
jgi:hypothetical protein